MPPSSRAAMRTPMAGARPVKTAVTAQTTPDTRMIHTRLCRSAKYPRNDDRNSGTTPVALAGDPAQQPVADAIDERADAAGQEHEDDDKADPAAHHRQETLQRMRHAAANPRQGLEIDGTGEHPGHGPKAADDNHDERVD